MNDAFFCTNDGVQVLSWKQIDIKTVHLTSCYFSLVLAMAGIIARITRSNRERLEKKKNEIGVGKCNYFLQPFDDHFVPEVIK